MNVFIEMAHKGLYALLQLLLNPFYYVGILFVILQYRRQIILERRLFHTKLHSLITQTWQTLLWGWIGGIAASILLAAIGATLQPEAVLLLWSVSLLLLLIRVRFLCWAYAVGFVGIMQAVMAFIPAARESAFISWFAEPLLQINMPSLLALTAVLHLVEALLVRQKGASTGTPMFYESKRGKVVGGYQLQGFWPVVLFLVVPMQGASLNPLPWSPLLGGDIWSGGWTLIGFPIMIGFSDMTLSRLPQIKAKLSANLLVLYSCAVLLMAVLTFYWPLVTAVASAGCIVLHEAIMFYSRWDESKRSPYFVHDPRGLKILGVLPNGAAAELGLAAGEIIHKVNGIAVQSKEELHQALQINSAFCKLEVLNLSGESKFLKRAMFSGDHHQLGILLAPDDDAMYYAKERQSHFLNYVSRRLTGLLSKSSSNTKQM